MDLAGVQRLKCSLPAVSRLHSLTHNSTPNHTVIVFSSEGLVRLGPAADTTRQRRTLTQTVLASAFTTSPEWAEDTRPSRLCGHLLCPRLALLLRLMLLTRCPVMDRPLLTMYRTLNPVSRVRHHETTRSPRRRASLGGFRF